MKKHLINSLRSQHCEKFLFYLSLYCFLLVANLVVAAPVAGSPNILPNPGFEEGISQPLKWSFVTNNGNTPVWDGSVSHSVSKSVKINVPGTSDIQSGYPKSDLIEILPGQLYNFSAWGKSDGVNGTNAPAVRVVELDSAKKAIKQTNLAFSKGTSDWVQQETSFKATAISSYCYVYANIWNSYGTFWLDDLKLVLNEGIKLGGAYRISGPADNLGLWWWGSTYKIQKERTLPEEISSGISISAAKNEYEPFQLVLRPTQNLGAVTVSATDLKNEKGGIIPSANVDIDLVYYLYISTPTDTFGEIGYQPDPLPHYKGAFSVEINKNQPIWFTVYVPPDTASGDYTGTIHLNADGVVATVPLRVHVYGFSLPRETHLRSGFGLDPINIKKYHNLETTEELSQVRGLYHRNFAAHRLCPYSPMRSIVVTNAGFSDSKCVAGEKYSGIRSLKIVDDSPVSNIAAKRGEFIPIDPTKEYKLSWAAKTEIEGRQYYVALNQYDSQGNWISGNNIGFVCTGSSSAWKVEERNLVGKFNAGAVKVKMYLYPAKWTSAGELMGTAWFDEVSLIKVESNNELIPEGNFDDPFYLRNSVALDFSNFDADAHIYLDELGFNSFMLPIPGMGSGNFSANYPGSFFGYEQGTPEYETLFAESISQIQNHLEEKGWLKKAYVYWYDEPEPKDYPFVAEGMALIKKYAPKLIRMLTEQPEPALYDNVDLWCPQVPYYNYEKAHLCQNRGEEIWWYVCCDPNRPYIGLFIDYSAIDLRLWSWMSWKYNIQGLLIWGTNSWTQPSVYSDPLKPQNPWEDPMTWKPDNINSGYYGNGDGRLLYPPNKDIVNDRSKYLEGPVNSIRWEMLREGVEDYEYFWLLKDKLKTSPPDPEAEKLLTVPDEIFTNLTSFTLNPQLLYNHREQMALKIEQLSHLSDPPLPPNTGDNGSLNNVKAYPNPYNPVRHTHGMKIEGLTADAVVKIYTVVGGLIRMLKESGNTGSVVWDGRNESGRTVASGVYLAHIKGAKGVKKIKLAVEK